MMDLSEKQWVRHTVFHPFEGYEDLRWKKAGSLKISFLIIFLLFIALIVNNRLYAFHLWNDYDKLFNIVPYIVRSVVFFGAWVIGNWSVCTLLDGEGTLRKICIYSSYALIPYIVMLYATTILSHFLVYDEGVFLTCIHYIGLGWTYILMFNAIKSVHQYSFIKTAAAIFLTIVAMLIIMFLIVLLMSLFQKVIIFIYSIYTEIQYRIKV